MLISICIPQYNRSAYLARVLESIADQDCHDLEIVVSDDCSKDDTAAVIPALLSGIRDRRGFRTRYIQQTANLGYDGNVRASLAGASGDWLFLLGNDDALSGRDAMTYLAGTIRSLGDPEVLFCNSCDYSDPSRVHRRAKRTAVLGRGPEVALRTFRCFSFFSGVAFKREAFAGQDTPAYDGSIYIQIYLAARIVAAGGALASVERPLVAKDVVVQGAPADTYRDTLARDNAVPMPRTGGLDAVAWVATEAVAGCLPPSKRQSVIRRTYGQVLRWSYPFWLLDYRSAGVRRAALNLARGCRPPNLLRRVRASLATRCWLWVLYVVSTAGGLFAPIGVLRRLARLLSPLSKRA